MSVLLSALFFCEPAHCGVPDTVRVLTINVWSGLDYVGTLSMGEYESPKTRELRFLGLLNGIRDAQPDIIYLQEANPVGAFSRRLADSLGYDAIWQVCNAGLKIAGCGIPSNLNEGVAILAKPELKLRRERAVKLSGPFGLHGNLFSLQFGEVIIVLDASVEMGGRRVRCINVHLRAVPEREYEGSFGREPDARSEYAYRSALKAVEFDKLSHVVSSIPAGTPYILGGDFNCTLSDSTFTDFLSRLGLRTLSKTAGDVVTWDAVHNDNIRYTTATTDARGNVREGFDKLSALADTVSRRLDYIFFGGDFEGGDHATEATVFNEPVGGFYPSDHYGIIALVPDANRNDDAQNSITDFSATPSKTELLPILSYDTDVGFGYGAKVFLLNSSSAGESIDLTVFNSTLGERWYRFVVSYPDIERRQGSVYPLALDLIVDYDLYIKNNFFGIGPSAQFAEREYYKREPLEVTLLASRGFTETVVAQFGFRYKYVRNRNIEPAGLLSAVSDSRAQSIARSASVLLSLSYDTRNSVVHPAEGTLLNGEVETAPSESFGNVTFTKTQLTVQHYSNLFVPSTVGAVRLRFQNIAGSVPVQFLLPLGGNNTLRGFVQDRFLGKTVVLANGEIRFPIYWRFAGVAGIDAGIVSESVSHVRIGDLKSSPVAGLRFLMDTFVVRCDIGFGPESTGFYLNFGHIF